MQPVSPYTPIPTADCPAKIESDAPLDKAELTWSAEDEDGEPSSVIEIILPEPEPELSKEEAAAAAKTEAVESKTESKADAAAEAKAEAEAAEAAGDVTIHFLIGTGNFRVVATTTSGQRAQSPIYSVQDGAPAIEMIVLTPVPPTEEEKKAKATEKVEDKATEKVEDKAEPQKPNPPGSGPVQQQHNPPQSKN